MYKTGEDEMVLCPYNRCHVVKKLRIQKHIIKCKKNYPDVNLATCVYNYSHRLKPEVLLEHYEICPYKFRFDGARYYDNDDFVSVGSSVKSEPQCNGFPDINVKARILPEFDDSFSQIDQTDSQYIGYSSSDSESNNSQYQGDDSGNEDELEPLPLPKTVSKAFVCVPEAPKEIEPPVISKPKTFGRGKSFLRPSSPTPSRSTDHLLPDLSGMECNTVKRDKPSWFFMKNTTSICSKSSELDDATTLKSVDISSLDEDVIDDSFVLKDFDKYVKI